MLSCNFHVEIIFLYLLLAKSWGLIIMFIAFLHIFCIHADCLVPSVHQLAVPNTDIIRVIPCQINQTLTPSDLVLHEQIPVCLSI